MARDAAWLGEQAGAAPSAADAVARLCAQQTSAPGEHGLRFRLPVLDSALAPALERLRRAGAEWLAYPGLGLVWAGFPLAAGDAPSAADAAWSTVAALAEGAGGGFRLEAAPLFAKRDRDVFGDTSALPLVTALKQRFDPGRVLNPGRFAGRI